jgi:hypothetical protein
VYHTIEFAADLTVDLEVSPMHRLERLPIRRGTRLSAQVKLVIGAQMGFSRGFGEICTTSQYPPAHLPR